MFSLIFTVIVGLNVFAIEYSRAVEVRKSMQKHLDSTLVHLSKDDKKFKPQTAGESFLANAVNNSSYDLSKIKSKFVWDNDTASLTGTVDFTPKSMIRGALFDGFAMGVEASVAPKMLGLVEIALVLDSSGSMLFPIDNKYSRRTAPVGERRIDSLHTAVTGLFDAIYENPTVIPKVAVIPYANTVDISDLYVNGDSGDFTPTWGRTYNDLQLNIITEASVEHMPNSYGYSMRQKGIWATERYQTKNSDGSFALSLLPPSTSNTLIPITSQRYTEPRCSRWTCYYLQARRWIGDHKRKNGYFFPHIGVLPQTTDASKVRNFVKSIEPNGGTAGHLGAIWGLYALSPAWHDVFKHPAGVPAPLSSDEKHLVIMTDGSFNSPQTAGMSTSDIFKYFQSVCDLARDSGVTVYTVGLLLQSDDMDRVLSECVTSPHRYYKVENHNDLVNAFKNIGRVTSQIRIAS